MNPLIDVYRNSVQVWQCDQMGHLNVQYYFDNADIGLSVLGRRLGLDPAFLSERQARIHVTESHVRFLREQYAGAPLVMQAGLIEAGPRQLEVYLELINPVSGEAAASFVLQAELRDRTGARLDFPETSLRRARDLLIEWPRPEAPRGLERSVPRPVPRLEEADALGMMPTYLGPVSAAMCDSDGRLALRSYMGVVSDAVPHLLARIRDEAAADRRLGGAALEYRWIYHGRPREGDLLALRSAIVDIGNKAYRLGHWLFDAETGHGLATTEAVAVMMDLDERKALVIPDAARESLQAMRVEGFSI